MDVRYRVSDYSEYKGRLREAGGCSVTNVFSAPLSSLLTSTGATHKLYSRKITDGSQLKTKRASHSVLSVRNNESVGGSCRHRLYSMDGHG